MDSLKPRLPTAPFIKVNKFQLHVPPKFKAVSEPVANCKKMFRAKNTLSPLSKFETSGCSSRRLKCHSKSSCPKINFKAYQKFKYFLFRNRHQYIIMEMGTELTEARAFIVFFSIFLFCSFKGHRREDCFGECRSIAFGILLMSFFSSRRVFSSDCFLINLETLLNSEICWWVIRHSSDYRVTLDIRGHC